MKQLSLEEMMKENRKLRLFPLSQKAKKVHCELYNEVLLPQLRMALPHEIISGIKRPNVFVDFDLSIWGQSIDQNWPLENPYILLNRDVASLKDNDDLKIFQKSSKKGNTPEDFLRYVLTHEYGHILSTYKALFPKSLRKIGVSKKKVASFDEGFSYWFSDELHKFGTFDENTAKCYSYEAHPSLIMKVYRTFSEISRRKGEDYILFNLHKVSKQVLLEAGVKLAV